MRRRTKLCLIVATICALGLSIVAYVLPIVQNAQASAVELAVAICDFIDKNGDMPTGLGELVSSGQLTHTEQGVYKSAITGKLIPAIDEIRIQWTIDKNRCKLDGEVLIELQSGKPQYIIRSARAWLPGQSANAMRLSVMIFRELIKPIPKPDG